MTLLKNAVTSASWRSEHPLQRLGSRVSACLVVLTLVCSAPPALAWSEPGHLAITELAVRQLPIEQRRQLNSMAESLIAQEKAVQDIPSGRGSSPPAKNLTPVARLSAWLDGLRGTSVEDIFARYGDEVPEALEHYAQSTTDDWHYSNLLFFPNKPRSCEHVDSGQLVEVLPRFSRAFEQAADPRDRAIVLAMLVHLVGDAHQPLHMVARAEQGCRHDRGGNGFCLQSGGGRCQKNLHRLWDSGLGLFYSTDLEQLILTLGQYPRPEPAVDDTQSADNGLAVKKWQQEGWDLAEEVYDTAEGRRPDAAYVARGREIALRRAAIAAYRLADILGQLEFEVRSANRSTVAD